ncbi:MAG: hypothetical protein QOG85_1352 [Gaiellaceae bacterium]|nr:hypothetical protein [Gaiellaceae bacterium]
MKFCLSAAATLIVALLLAGTALANGQRHPLHRTSLSLYERDASVTRLADQGCAAARRDESGIVVLDFGKPSYAHHEYGTLDFSNEFISNHEITMGMLGWARGYVRCLPRYSNAFVTLARGTSNYYPSVPSIGAAGKHWAGAVLTLERKLRRNGLAAHVRSAAADDAEPAWDRSFNQTFLFIHGFRKWSHGRTLYDYGSLDGGVGSIWSATQVMYVTGGKGPSAVLPEIYYPSQAAQWAQLAYIAHRWFHRRLHFAGVMTQGSPSCDCGYRPHAAHRALVRELKKVDTGRRIRVPRVGTTIVSG